MFSGGDSSEAMNNFNQASMTPFQFMTQAMAAGQNIDWAQLAQQWIQMRDNNTPMVDAPAAPMTSVPPPPNLSAFGLNVDNCLMPNLYNTNNKQFVEKGEADMDMDEEDHADEKCNQSGQAAVFSNVSALQEGQNNSLQPPWLAQRGNNSQSVSGKIHKNILEPNKLYVF